jgi:hypothetical protein
MVAMSMNYVPRYRLVELGTAQASSAASSNMHLRKLLSPTRHEWGGRLYEW